MKEIVNTVRHFTKRPYILFAFVFIMFIYCLVEYVFLFPLISGVSAFLSGNILNDAMHFIQLLFSFVIHIEYLLYGLGAIVLTALVCGFVLSGSLNSLNRYLEGKDIVKGEFRTGVKKYFFRMFFITMRVMVYTVLFVVFLLVVSVPSLVVTNAYITGKEELLTATVTFDLITVGVLFFGLLFFRIYMMFWFPSAVNLVGKFFAIGKHVSDTCFWFVALNLILFDMAFLSLQYILIYMNSIMPFAGFYGILRILVLFFFNWIIKTCLITMLGIYVFSRFLLYKRTIND